MLDGVYLKVRLRLSQAEVWSSKSVGISLTAKRTHQLVAKREIELHSTNHKKQNSILFFKKQDLHMVGNQMLATKILL